MSETAISRFAISRPLALLTFRLRLFLLTFVSLKFPEVFKLTSRFCGVVVLGSLPRSFSGHSILMTSAPKAPSQRVAHGPARTQLKSTTRTPSRARRRDMCALPRSEMIAHHRLTRAELLQAYVHGLRPVERRSEMDRCSIGAMDLRRRRGSTKGA